MSKHYFVTGATGAVGSALLPLLLKDKSNRIWAIIRGDTEEKVQNRFNELLSFWGMQEEQAEDARQRITVLRGDTDLPYFALPKSVYQTITHKCTHVIHCAGVVRMNLPIEVARTHVMMSSQNIVDLALECQANGNFLQKIEFVSTVGVGGCLPGVLPEKWITEPRTYHNTYEQAKAEAEDFIREQIQLHQLPITIHRPSMVVGDSKTGKIIHHQIFYYICEFLTGRRTSGLLPVLGDVTLDTIPVDYVAEVLHWSSLQNNLNNQILHICSGPKGSILLTDLQKTMRQLLKKKQAKLPKVIHLPITMFDVMLRSISLFLVGKTKRSIKTIPFFLNYLKFFQGFDNHATIKLLQECKGPSLSKHEDYIEKVLGNYISNQK